MRNTHARNSTSRLPSDVEGILFFETVGTTDHKCLIPNETLRRLCSDADVMLPPKQIFWEHEDRIRRVARRAVDTGRIASPLVLKPEYFS